MVKKSNKKVARKKTQTNHPVDRLYGELKLGQSVDEILDLMRGPRPVSEETSKRNR
jgi:hypothetical protein